MNMYIAIYMHKHTIAIARAIRICVHFLQFIETHLFAVVCVSHDLREH